MGPVPLLVRDKDVGVKTWLGPCPIPMFINLVTLDIKQMRKYGRALCFHECEGRPDGPGRSNGAIQPECPGAAERARQHRERLRDRRVGHPVCGCGRAARETAHLRMQWWGPGQNLLQGGLLSRGGPTNKRLSTETCARPVRGCGRAGCNTAHLRMHAQLKFGVLLTSQW